MLRYLILIVIAYLLFLKKQVILPFYFPVKHFLLLQTDSIPKGFEIVNILPEPYVKDASVDYTNLIQQAINKYDTIIFPDFPLLISQNGLKIPSHKNLYFKKGSILKFIENDSNTYRVLLLKNVEDVHVYFPVIMVQKAKKEYTSNGTSLGIAIYSSKNISITNPVIKNCSGDGIYIGESEDSSTPENITITNAFCDSNKRNGLTIISGNNININGGFFSNTIGRLPMAGIDIEPNNGTNQLKDITIKNAYTINNKGKGLQIGLSKFLKDSCKPMLINILNHHDSASGLAIVLSAGKADKCTNFKSIINIDNPVWKNNKAGNIKMNKSNRIVPFIFIKNPVIVQDNIDLNKAIIKARILQNENKSVDVSF